MKGKRNPYQFSCDRGEGRARSTPCRQGYAATARMYGVPIYVWENGKVVAVKQ